MRARDSLGFGIWDLGFALYVAGVVSGLVMIDARPAERIVVALLWPLGPLAFIVTVTILLIALPIAFPVVGILFWLAVGAMLWWILA
jgi:hypothetical protein